MRNIRAKQKRLEKKKKRRIHKSVKTRLYNQNTPIPSPIKSIDNIDRYNHGTYDIET
jgi:hypothetical protein